MLLTLVSIPTAKSKPPAGQLSLGPVVPAGEAAPEDAPVLVCPPAASLRQPKPQTLTVLLCLQDSPVAATHSCSLWKHWGLPGIGNKALTPCKGR